MRRCYVVVEPHADDAFLSLGAHIEHWVKASGHFVTIVTMRGFMDNDHPKRHEDARNYAAAVGAEWVERGLNEKMPPGQLILPLAFRHPDHETVRLHLERKDSWYYVDQPYAIVQKNGDELNRKLEGRRIISYKKPHARKYRHIPLFKHQAKFFHYNPAEKLRETFEMIVK